MINLAEVLKIIATALLSVLIISIIKKVIDTNVRHCSYTTVEYDDKLMEIEVCGKPTK